jgi:Domain of unknown function (DUF4431)
MFSAVTLLLLQLAVSDSTSRDCYPYEPAVVSLSGKLIRETFPGPPNYHSVKEGEAETFFSLVLSKRLCTFVDENDFNNRAEKSVEKLQLVFLGDASEKYKKYRPYLGRNTQCKGKLFSALTGHHYIPVLMIVESCEPTPPSPQGPKSK